MRRILSLCKKKFRNGFVNELVVEVVWEAPGLEMRKGKGYLKGYLIHKNNGRWFISSAA